MGADWYKQTANPTGISQVHAKFGAIPSKKWTYVAYVVDGAHTFLYINGVQVDKEATYGSQLTGGPLVIGKKTPLYFTGSLDEFRYWTVARSEQDVCLDGGGAWSGPDICQIP